MEVFLEQINIDPKRFNDISVKQLKAARLESLNNPSKESCGLFCFLDKEIKFISCENLSVDPSVSFVIDFRQIANFDVRYIFHSHINGCSEYPSSYDMKYSDELCIPFIIYSISRDSFFVYDNISV